MRREYYLSQEQLAELLEASKPVPVLYLSGGERLGPTQQERAHRVWEKLGKELGFDYLTVQPVPGKSPRYFTAEERAADD